MRVVASGGAEGLSLLCGLSHPVEQKGTLMPLSGGLGKRVKLPFFLCGKQDSPQPGTETTSRGHLA